MKRRIRLLVMCVAAAFLAVRLLGQDTGGGDNGAAAGGVSGEAGGAVEGTSGASGGQTGGTGGDTNRGNGPSNGSGNGNGNPSGVPGTSNGTSGENGGTGTENQGGGGIPSATPAPSPPNPPSTLPPGNVAPVPGTSPSPSPLPSATPVGPNTINPGTARTQAAPTTFTLPGGYGGGAAQTLTLGQGRLAKPPLTFTATVSEGYDSNLYDTPSHYTFATPRPAPTPPLEARVIGFRETPPLPPTPVLQFFRPKSLPTPTPGPTPQGRIGSFVTSVALAAQAQIGTARTALTADLSGAANRYWERPGTKTDYTANADAQLVHRLTPRATVSLYLNAVYQQTPNFALVNAPTNNNTNGSYLNGVVKTNLAYSWGARLSTITAYALNLNLQENQSSENFFTHTFGNQLRYTVSQRNVVTAEIREEVGVYPSNSVANNSSTFFLAGLDSVIFAKLRNSVSAGIQTYSPSGGATQTLPYFESSTTLALPRQGGLVWTNNYGFQQPGSVTNVATRGDTVTSYRTALSYSQPLSTKLVGSLSIAYNNIATKAVVAAGGPNTQNQFQASASLGYSLSPRFSLSLSYTYIDLHNTAPNSSYTRDQVYLGGTYTFR